MALFAGLIAFVAHVGLTTALVRSARDRSPVIFHVMSAVGVCVILVAVVLFLNKGDPRAVWISGSVLYGCAVGFLFLFSAVYKSISLEVLCVLKASPHQYLSLDVISQQVVLPRFVERIELLIAAGLVQHTDDGYMITAQGHEAARRLTALQRFAGVTNSGLYVREGSS